MSHRNISWLSGTSEHPISQGLINQVAHCDLRGLRNRGGITAVEAHELRVALFHGNDWARRHAIQRVRQLLVASPSPMKGHRRRKSEMGGRRRGDSNGYYNWDHNRDHNDSYPSRNGYGSSWSTSW